MLSLLPSLLSGACSVPMPQLTIDYSKRRDKPSTSVTDTADCDWSPRWMEKVKDDLEAERTGLRSWLQTVAAAQSQLLSWLRTQRAQLPWKSCWSVVAVGVVWSVCQVEAQLHPSAYGLLLLCLVWTLLTACVHALKGYLQRGQTQEEPLQIHQEIHDSLRAVQWSRPDCHAPLALVLADTLLLCVLQEPLPDPTVAHIQALLSSLQLVSQTLERAYVGSEEAVEEADTDDSLTKRVRLIYSYLQQRVLSLGELLKVQSNLETSVSDVQQGLDGLWAQLEELHTGVTLSKKGHRGPRELASAQADVKTMITEVDQYRDRLQCCQSHLKDSIRVLQELTWSHANVSHTVNSSIESVWPEKLLQSNIEQSDKLQERFLSLEQQTLTFLAHLEGLGRDDKDSETSLCTSSRQGSPQLHSEGLSDTSSLSLSSADVDEDVDDDTPLSLCERSALPFSYTIERLRKSRRRK